MTANSIVRVRIDCDMCDNSYTNDACLSSESARTEAERHGWTTSNSHGQYDRCPDCSPPPLAELWMCRQKATGLWRDENRDGWVSRIQDGRVWLTRPIVVNTAENEVVRFVECPL